jgi:cation diffusion facilitator family transporter
VLHAPSSNSASRESAALTGVVAGLADTGITIVAMMASHSSVLLADTCKTMLEFVAVLMAWFAIRRINRGANHQFDYGIGKLENLSSLLVGLLMILCLLIIAVNTVRNIMHPSHIQGFGVWISIAAQVVYAGINGFLCVRNRRMAAAEASPIMASQARLFLTKALANLFILASLILSMALAKYQWSLYIDPIASLVIGGSILLAAVGILKSSFYDLLDRTLEETSQVFILRELARHFDEYEALHGLRSRRAGSKVFVEIFLEFDPDKKVGEVQDVINRLRLDIENAVQGSRVTIALATEPVH